MESFKLREKNIALARIKDINVYIKRNNDTISNFQKNNIQTSFEIKQIEKLKLNNKDFEKEISILNKRIEDIISGNLNSEFNNLITLTQQNQIKSKEKETNKIIKKNQKNVDDKKCVLKSFQINGNYNEDYYMDKEYYKFVKVCNNIPDYILRNLKEMPSNKGYIWKGVWCFGELPDNNSGQLLMFEKLYGGILRIYEIDDNYRTIYEKQDGKRKLISKEPRSKFIKEYIKETRNKYRK